MRLENIIQEGFEFGAKPLCTVTLSTSNRFEVDSIRGMLGREVKVEPKNDVKPGSYLTVRNGDGLWPKENPYVAKVIKTASVVDAQLNCPKNRWKIIFNNPATILIDTATGKKYVSKAHGEEFDEEKGLLMCLCKAYGISHLELKRMIKKAKKIRNKK